MLEKGRSLRDKISLGEDEYEGGGREVEAAGGSSHKEATAGIVKALSRDTGNEPSASSSEEEEDFMSDAFLAEGSGSSKTKNKEETYTERRRREVNQARERGKTMSRADREQQARREGLSRNLFGEFDTSKEEHDERGDGRGSNKRRKMIEEGATASSASAGRPNSANSTSNKALKMMAAMGYEHGRSLGRRDEGGEEEGTEGEGEEKEEEEEEGEDDDREPQRVSSRQSIDKSSRLIEPLPIDERWLGSRKRAGIGQLSTQSAQASLSRDISAALTKEEEAGKSSTASAEALFRSRSSAEHTIRHCERVLVDARRTCEDLDTEQGVKYSPLWINPESLSKQASELPEHVAQLIQFAFAGLEEENTASSSSSPSSLVDEEAIARAKETRQFCFLPAKVRLDITNSHLRRAHNYCLYCGQQYKTPEELASQCPGEDEDDH